MPLQKAVNIFQHFHQCLADRFLFKDAGALYIVSNSPIILRYSSNCNAWKDPHSWHLYRCVGRTFPSALLGPVIPGRIMRWWWEVDRNRVCSALNIPTGKPTTHFYWINRADITLSPQSRTSLTTKFVRNFILWDSNRFASLSPALPSNFAFVCVRSNNSTRYAASASIKRVHIASLLCCDLNSTK